MPLDYLSFAVILAGLGLVLFLAEYFLPTGGILLVAGLMLCVVGVFVIAYYGETREAVAAVVALCVGVPLAGTGLVYFWGRRMALRAGGGDNADDTPAVAGVEALKGRVGRTATPMRPAGAVEFDGRRYDAMTEGMMLDAGVWVKCVGVRAGNVIVRQIPKPPDLDEIELDDLK